MNRFGNGMVAGFVATVVLSVLMLIKGAMGFMPHLNVIVMLSNMIGAPNAPIAGWVAHFAIGTVAWGLLFGALAGRLPGDYWFQGVLFATGAWLLMMIVIMPMAGAGLFGAKLGVGAPIITLVLHWIFGAVMGATFGALHRSERARGA